MLMVKIDINTEENVTKSEKHKKIAIRFEKKSGNLIQTVFKLIKSLLKK